MQKPILAFISVVTLAACVLAARPASLTSTSRLPEQDPAAAPRVRIGTYDSRAIAIAYAPSEHNPVAEKMKAHASAKAQGDQRQVAELEAWGAAHQRQLHRQGFGRVPVDDLLAPVAHRLPEVAKAAGVDAIVFSCEHHSSEVELVDVTLALVALYEPSERTLEHVRSSLKTTPLSLAEIDELKD